LDEYNSSPYSLKSQAKNVYLPIVKILIYVQGKDPNKRKCTDLNLYQKHSFTGAPLKTISGTNGQTGSLVEPRTFSKLSPQFPHMKEFKVPKGIQTHGSDGQVV
jgi:hypothetical protein